MLQKCFRHFDVRTVGTTNTHLSLFEMAAAFTFGGDSKSADVHRTWELLTSSLGCPSEDMWGTYFSGDKVSGHTLSEDSEVCAAWKSSGVLAERIVGSGANTNFWKQGDGLGGLERNRKCGTNTEVFFDRGPHLSCGPECAPGGRCRRFVEIANLLFVDSEMDRQTDTFRLMKRPFSELVVGTERLAMVLQDRESIFEIDSIAHTKAVIRKFSQTDGTPAEMVCASENILADHWRALLFLVADGAAPPGKDGRQRIIRMLVRAILTRQILLGIRDDVLPAIADRVTTMCLEPPRAARARDVGLRYIREEHLRFLKTLGRGCRQFNRHLEENHGTTLTGDQVVNLEKRCGVPSPMVEMWLLRVGLPFDRLAYEAALRRWRLSLERPVGELRAAQ